ncbi:DUF3857 domain-containing protein [Caulobacter sp. 602-1]|uniref:DUF3857 domain-containing protein n=1 Tax=Caulobacter sp. 602-1 TaxID=2492472 RepID=UPI000F64285C|nr:DUF3857 domain-containing protein [Caulobacter sp. 602-1]RRN65589.1 DUF3857 domain-containing protein [Caulobacter sp. 602-1]
MRVMSLAAMAALVLAGGAHAGSRTVQYGPAPAWVIASPAATGSPAQEGAAFQVIYLDNQTRLSSDGDEFYTAYRFKILRPEALSIGNLTAVWSPGSDDIRIHRLKIIRDGREIDVLAANRFKVIQREDELAAAMLYGNLTATLQAPGLQVGDELEFALTIRRRDPTLGDHAQGALQLPAQGAPGAYRLRLLWPTGKAVQWRASSDLGELRPIQAGGENLLSYELRDPKTVVLTDGAPPRYNVRRLLQFSGFSSWSEVSSVLAPFYEVAQTAAPNSPIRAEAARIAVSTQDPAARAEAALKLVQERIRYVYVGLADANYRPASVDETWTRKFGDCKAKTALLLALLRELDIPAEAVLVNSQGGDAIEGLLPMLNAFDHVLVRARIGDKSYWLDGTRIGDQRLDQLTPPTSRWALPIRTKDAAVERIQPDAPMLAETGQILDIDARAGFDKPAKIEAREFFRGDEALMLKAKLSQLSPEDSERAQRDYWAKDQTWAEPKTVGWTYDPAQTLLIMTMTGEGPLEWEGDETEGRRLDIQNAGFSPPAPYKRGREQDQDAPWLIEFPAYRRWTTVLRLPHVEGKSWSFRASDMDIRMGGVAYRRDAVLYRDNVTHQETLRTIMSRRALAPEITADEARETNKQLQTFDNRVSFVYQDEPLPSNAVMKASVEERAGKDPQKLTDGARFMRGEGETDLALKLLDKALVADPRSKDAAQLKFDILAADRDAKKALAFADARLKTDPTTALALARARLLIKQGRRDEGFAAMDAVAAAHPDDAGVLSDYAEEARQARRTDEALQAIAASIKLMPGNVTSHRVKAALLVDQMRYADALVEMQEAFRLEPEQSINLVNRAIAYRHLGRIDEALADVDEAIRMDPISSGALTIKSQILRQAGRNAEAAAVFDRMVALERNSQNLNSRCWARALSKVELAGAEADCAEAVKMSPGIAAFWDSYALVALRTGRLDEALKRYDQALTLQPRLAGSLYGRGLARLSRGDVPGGRADIAAAKTISPTVDAELIEAGVAKDVPDLP